jgi:hypothetical protein
VLRSSIAVYKRAEGDAEYADAAVFTFGVGDRAAVSTPVMRNGALAEITPFKRLT